MKILLGIYDKKSSRFDKYFLIDLFDYNNFVKNLRVIVNDNKDVYSIYCDDFVLQSVSFFDELGICKHDDLILPLSSLKEVVHE